MNYLELKLEELKEDLKRLKATISSIEIAVQCKPPIGYDAGLALMQAATQVNATLAKIDALSRVEKYLPNSHYNDKKVDDEKNKDNCSYCNYPLNSSDCQKSHP